MTHGELRDTARRIRERERGRPAPGYSVGFAVFVAGVLYCGAMALLALAPVFFPSFR